MSFLPFLLELMKEVKQQLLHISIIDVVVVKLKCYEGKQVKNILHV